MYVCTWRVFFFFLLFVFRLTLFAVFIGVVFVRLQSLLLCYSKLVITTAIINIIILRFRAVCISLFYFIYYSLSSTTVWRRWLTFHHLPTWITRISLAAVTSWTFLAVRVPRPPHNGLLGTSSRRPIISNTRSRRDYVSSNSLCRRCLELSIGFKN